MKDEGGNKPFQLVLPSSAVILHPSSLPSASELALSYPACCDARNEAREASRIAFGKVLGRTEEFVIGVGYL
jgi:hypothetical protein